MMKKALFASAIAAVGVLAGPADSSQAPGFRRLATGNVRLASDGTRYAAWQTATGGPVQVEDTQAERVRAIAVPTECLLMWQEAESGPTAAAGRFLLNCRGKGGVLDVRTGGLITLPSPGGRIGIWNSLGSRYVEGSADAAACGQSREEARRGEPCIALYDLATGTLTHPSRRLGIWTLQAPRRFVAVYERGSSR